MRARPLRMAAAVLAMILSIHFPPIAALAEAVDAPSAPPLESTAPPEESPEPTAEPSPEPTVEPIDSAEPTAEPVERPTVPDPASEPEAADGTQEPSGQAEAILRGAADDFAVEAAGGGLAITGYAGSETELVIPPSIGGIPVIAIASEAFYLNRGIVSVTIPGSVASIGDYAFCGCDKLASVSLSDGLRTIGDGAFSECRALTDIRIPGSAASVGDRAFQACKKLADVSLEEGLEAIGNSAFNLCESLTGIAVPDSVASIGEGAFSACIKLAGASLGGGLTKIERGTFNGCASLADIRIPEGVTAIGDGAFAECASLTEIAIPESAASIGNDAFRYCAKLARATLNDGLEAIGSHAFADCASLAAVEIPGSVTAIGNYAFRGCAKLENASLADGLQTIGMSAFSECASLRDIAIPGSVTSMGISAFSDCAKLARVSLNHGVKTIEKSAFIRCSSLTEVNLPGSVTAIEDWAFGGCASLAEINLPSGVASIGDYAFYECASLTAISLPASVASIGDYAYFGCAGLKKATVHNRSMTFGLWAFMRHSLPEFVSVPLDTVFYGYPGSTAQAYAKGYGYAFRDINALLTPTSVKLDRTGTVTLHMGSTLTLTPTLAPSTAGTKYTWSSSSTKIVKVKNGVLTPVKEGTATITVKTANGKSASVKIKVVDPYKPTSVKLNRTGTATLYMGSILTLTPKLAPSTARTTLAWKSSSTKIVKVKNGVLTPVKEGTATIAVKTANGKTASVRIKVVDPYKPTSVKLDRTGTVTLYMGSTLSLTPKLAPSTARTTLAWKSSSTKIVKVKNGVLTPVKEGTATITVKTANGKTASVKIKVVDPYKPTSVKLDRAGTVTLKLGDTLTLTPALSPSTARTTYTWISSSTKIAKVKDGVVTPVKTGTATITVATANGKKATVKVKVVK